MNIKMFSLVFLYIDLVKQKQLSFDKKKMWWQDQFLETQIYIYAILSIISGVT